MPITQLRQPPSKLDQLAQVLAQALGGYMQGGELKRRRGLDERGMTLDEQMGKARMADMQRPPQAKMPFTAGAVQKVLGALRAGGHRIGFFGELEPFKSRDDAIQYALRTIGRDFAINYPEVLAEIDRRYPAEGVMGPAMPPGQAPLPPGGLQGPMGQLPAAPQAGPGMGPTINPKLLAARQAMAGKGMPGKTTTRRKEILPDSPLADVLAKVRGKGTATSETGRVTVISPTGQTGTIPRSQLAAARKAGYKLVTK